MDKIDLSKKFTDKIKQLDDSYKINYMAIHGKKSNLNENAVSFFAEKFDSSNINKVIKYIYCETGLARIDSGFCLKETISFFEERGISILNKNFNVDFIFEIKNIMKKYVDLDVGSNDIHGKLRISFEEKFYFVIVDYDKIELVKTFVVELKNYGVLFDRFRIDFFSSNFKYASKLYDYNEENKIKVIKALRLISCKFLNNFAKSVGIDLSFKNIEENADILKLLKY